MTHLKPWAVLSALLLAWLGQPLTPSRPQQPLPNPIDPVDETILRLDFFKGRENRDSPMGVDGHPYQELFGRPCPYIWLVSYGYAPLPSPPKPPETRDDETMAEYALNFENYQVHRAYRQRAMNLAQGWIRIQAFGPSYNPEAERLYWLGMAAIASRGPSNEGELEDAAFEEFQRNGLLGMIIEVADQLGPRASTVPSDLAPWLISQNKRGRPVSTMSIVAYADGDQVCPIYKICTLGTGEQAVIIDRSADHRKDPAYDACLKAHDELSTELEHASQKYQDPEYVNAVQNSWPSRQELAKLENSQDAGALLADFYQKLAEQGATHKLQTHVGSQTASTISGRRVP